MHVHMPPQLSPARMYVAATLNILLCELEGRES